MHTRFWRLDEGLFADVDVVARNLCRVISLGIENRRLLCSWDERRHVLVRYDNPVAFFVLSGRLHSAKILDSIHDRSVDELLLDEVCFLGKGGFVDLQDVYGFPLKPCGLEILGMPFVIVGDADEDALAL